MTASPRIVTLLPSATEIVAALGMADHIVGISHECDWPAEIRDRPVVTSTRMRHSRASGAIDRDVRGILRDALAVYDIDTDELQRLAPDVIVTQDLCDVCAVSFDDVCAAAQKLANPDLRIVNTHPKRLADIWTDIRKTARALDLDRTADQLLAALDARVEKVRRRSAGLPRPTVLAIEWLDPVMIGGMWSPELIELAGGEPLVGEAGAHAPTLEPDQLAELGPDVVLVKPCGFDIERTLEEDALLREVLATLGGSAVAEGRVFVADGNAYFNRPGPRIVDSLELLAACVHPEAFGDFAAEYEGAVQVLEA